MASQDGLHLSTQSMGRASSGLAALIRLQGQAHEEERIKAVWAAASVQALPYFKGRDHLEAGYLLRFA